MFLSKFMNQFKWWKPLWQLLAHYRGELRDMQETLTHHCFILNPGQQRAQRHAGNTDTPLLHTEPRPAESCPSCTHRPWDRQYYGRLAILQCTYFHVTAGQRTVLPPWCCSRIPVKLPEKLHAAQIVAGSISLDLSISLSRWHCHSKYLIHKNTFCIFVNKPFYPK